jgi:hypothetical protein
VTPSTSRPSRHVMPSRPARATVAAALAVGAVVASASVADADATTTPERVVLSPTADPATSQTVTWRTPASAPAVVQHGPAAGGEVTTTSGTATGVAGAGHHHRADLTGLRADTTYRYRVGDGTTWSEWATFTTASGTDEPFRFLYFGDVQNDITAGAAPVVRAAYDAVPEAELAVHAGDLVNDAESDSQWGEWFAAQGDAATSINHITTLGNHEYEGIRRSSFWTRHFPGTGNGPDDDDLGGTVWYTDYQGVRFVTLNGNFQAAPWLDIKDWMEDQAAWLDDVLEDNPNEWTVVTYHQPMFGSSEGRTGLIPRHYWLDVIEEHDVDLVLQGHDHTYARGGLRTHETGRAGVTAGPVYVVAVTGPKMYTPSTLDWRLGGARARTQLGDTQTYQVVAVDDGRLDYEARTADGTVVDAFEIDKTSGQKVVRDR